MKSGKGYISFLLYKFNFKVHLIHYQLISVMLGDWQASVLCIWLRCREALESVMKKALGESGQGEHNQCMCVCVRHTEGSAVVD